MTKQQQFSVPAQLIAQFGTGEDTLGLIGKRIRVTDTFPPKAHPCRILFDINLYGGAEGMVIHVSENGDIWADFGDDEYIPPVGESLETAVRVHAIGNVDQDTPLEYEVIG